MDDITIFGPMGLRDLCGVLVASGTQGSQGGVSSVDSEFFFIVFAGSGSLAFSAAAILATLLANAVKAV
jgi:hypothetical protein